MLAFKEKEGAAGISALEEGMEHCMRELEISIQMYITYCPTVLPKRKGLSTTRSFTFVDFPDPQGFAYRN